MCHTNIKVTTTTGVLGTQADIVLFLLTRNNPGRNVGAAGGLQDLNVAISRSKEKLIILGNFDMMLMVGAASLRLAVDIIIKAQLEI
jgi:superfamily I DNA and/or RNA helicase